MVDNTHMVELNEVVLHIVATIIGAHQSHISGCFWLLFQNFGRWQEPKIFQKRMQLE